MKIAIVLRHDLLKSSFAAHAEELSRRDHNVRWFVSDTEWKQLKEKILLFEPDVIWTWNGRFAWYENLFYELSRNFRVVVSEMAWLPQKGNHFICGFEDSFHRCDWRISPSYPIAEGVLEDLKNGYQVVDPTFSKDYMVIPFQLENDTSITRLSPVYKTNLQTVYRAKATFPDLELIISKHPRQKDIPYDGPGIEYFGSCTTLDLAVNAKWLVAINSTVTIETLLWHGNVMVFGYNPARQVLLDGFSCEMKPHTQEERYRVLSYLFNRQYKPEIPDAKVLAFIEGDLQVYEQ